ncbi:MAG: tetratricopeptide repeat protein [Desulfatibacillaceae bacterium]|nr:tetratricopeptide repeat protein [Desulfatibacillaceae bacterium]
MSTIHEALKKVQQEREASSKAYLGVGKTGPPKPKKPLGLALLTLGAALALTLVATAGYLLLGPDKKPETATPLAGIGQTPAEAVSPGPVAADRQRPAAQSPEETASGKSLPAFLKNAKPFVPGEGVRAPSPIRPSGAKMAAALGAGREQAPPPSPALEPAPLAFATTAPAAQAPPPMGAESFGEPQDGLVAPANTQGARELFERGLDQQVAGNMETAAQYYAQSLEEDPDYVPSLNNMAVIAMERGQLELAERALQQAVTIGSGSPDPYYNLACLYAGQGDIEQALEYLNRAIEKEPEAALWAQQDLDLEILYNEERFLEITGR